LLPQLVVAAKQVVEQPLALLGSSGRRGVTLIVSMSVKFLM